MLILLLKSSIIWAIMLIFYFVFLQQEKAPKLNRFYLWMSLIMGILIPIVENPFESIEKSQTVKYIQNNISIPQVQATLGDTQTTVSTFDPIELIFYIWIIGIMAQTFFFAKNAFQLYYLKKHSTKIQHSIAPYWVNNNTKNAFSFGKNIFLPDTSFEEKDLNFIIQHEHNHYKHLHSIDNVILELLQIFFWFHPLFYVFKKQLKLVHEYQVDADVAINERYAYGKLLLIQNNKSYVTTFIHTFNFSPLKKRINMMTNTKKANKWKFLFALPIIGICFGLMSAQQNSEERIRKGDITTFRGNTIEWKTEIKKVEIMVIDPVTGEEVTQNIQSNESKIIKCNNKLVSMGAEMDMETGQMEYGNPAFKTTYLNITDAITAQKGKIPSEIANIEIFNLILDKNFNVYYYDVSTTGENGLDTNYMGLNKFSKINKIVDNVLKNKNILNPSNAKLDKDFYVFNVNVNFKPITFKAIPYNSETKKAVDSIHSNNIQKFMDEGVKFEK